MGNWNPDEDDDWRGWSEGKYDNRYGGRKYGGKFSRNSPRNKAKSVIAIITLFGILAVIISVVSPDTVETTFEKISNAANELDLDSDIISDSIEIPELSDIEKQIIETTKEIQSQINNFEINAKPEINISELEFRVHELINVERQNHGLGTFSYDSKIAYIARLHSVDMGEKNYFEHENSFGADASDRGIRAGYEFCGDADAIKLANDMEYYRNRDIPTYNNYVMQFNQLGQQGKLHSGFAENIAQTWLYTSYMTKGIESSYTWQTQEGLAQSIVDQWMNSPGHRDNILSPHQSEGIGIAITSDHKVFATQDFC